MNTNTLLKTAIANMFLDALDQVAANNGQQSADDVAAAYLSALQIYLKNTHGPRRAYDAFQVVADDIAETMIAEPRR